LRLQHYGILGSIPSGADRYHLHCIAELKPMSRATILIAYIAIDLLIVGGVVWCVFHHLPVSKYFFPAILLFMANGAWLVVMTVRKTPPRQ
jgi:hypothetical protein